MGCKSIALLSLCLVLSSCTNPKGNSDSSQANYSFIGNWGGKGADSKGNPFIFFAKVSYLGKNKYRMLILADLDTQNEPMHIMDGVLENNKFSYTADEGLYKGDGTYVMWRINTRRGIMKISRVTILTLGVADLGKATEFYEAVLGTPPNKSFDGITFIELPGTWIALYPFEKLAEDISPEIPATRSGFSGVTLAYNAGSKEEVLEIVRHAKSAGARIVKEPKDTDWGGFSGYFADIDGYYWEVAWGPMFKFTENGEMTFKVNE